MCRKLRFIVLRQKHELKELKHVSKEGFNGLSNTDGMDENNYRV